MNLDDWPDALGLRVLFDRDNRWHDCLCGTGDRYFGSRARHASWHLNWDYGVTVPSGVFWPDSLAVVNGESKRKEQEVAYTLGRLFQREEGYDFPMAPAPRSWRGDLSEVLIATYDDRAIGGLFTYPTSNYGMLSAKDDDGYIRFNVKLLEPQPKIAGIWVARGYRRRRVGSALVAALGRRADIAVTELIWALPLSDAGRALALATAGDDLRVCG